MKLDRFPLFVLLFFACGKILAAETTPIHVVVWDEQQPRQKQAYENFLGNAIDAAKGPPADMLNNCQVLIWWGHVRQREIPWETGQQIVSRVKSGQLGLIILHSAHWSTPFIEAMNEVTRERVRNRFERKGE